MNMENPRAAGNVEAHEQGTNWIKNHLQAIALTTTLLGIGGVGTAVVREKNQEISDLKDRVAEYERNNSNQGQPRIKDERYTKNKDGSVSVSATVEMHVDDLKPEQQTFTEVDVLTDSAGKLVQVSLRERNHSDVATLDIKVGEDQADFLQRTENWNDGRSEKAQEFTVERKGG